MMRSQIKAVIILAVLALTVPQAVHAGTIAFGFEFNTPGDDEGWQHNGATNGGSSNTTGPTAVTVAGTGEGVLTAQQLPGNGDLRVLYNPDLALDTSLYSSWDAVEVRFRQLDGLNGTPQALTGNTANMHLGINGTATISVDGTAFVEETPGSTEYWYTATLDISSHGTADITQIRLDPLASTSLDYQLDFAHVCAVPIPEPAGVCVLALGVLASVVVARRRK